MCHDAHVLCVPIGYRAPGCYAGGRQAFHWPFAGSRHALSVRFLSKGDEDEPEGTWMWSGDLRLDTLGEVAVKLRTAAGVAGMSRFIGRRPKGNHSEYIARVKLALVGASITAVFERQVRKISTKATTADRFSFLLFVEWRLSVLSQFFRSLLLSVDF